MNKLYYVVTLLVAVVSVMCCCACSSSDSHDESLPEVKAQDEYYVRYEVTCISDHPKSVKKLNVTTERGNMITYMTEGSTSKWQAIFGPLPKGYHVGISCDSEDSEDNSQFDARIEVSKNGSPFVLKQEDHGHSLILSYVVN